ncbi:unnamed protein product [Phytophthora lilii]|uniref:feruloyl esterase n=1 Tax=Phytophthora lilii TaxID=2077276 RepID=A0A9W6UEW1_9STRA|nr:unnamed protein product [Phytophthora lilii]
MLRLPISTWTQRYLQSGRGGLCGADQVTLSVVAAEGSDQYENGHFAMATTDMDGTTEGSFALNEDAFIDFAYLAVHHTAEVSKALIKQYYGQEHTYAYFNGCSDGGREAVMSALRYPEDFNGIVAGAPAFLFQFQNSFHHAWDALSNLEPRRHLEPFYSGPIDEGSGEHLTVGEMQFGSENGWIDVGVPATDGGSVPSESMALSTLRYLIFKDVPGANYTLHDLVFANSTIDLLQPHHPFLDAVSPDLSAFREAGGKLILWHG